MVATGSALHAQATSVRGTVSNGAGQPVAHAVVELLLHSLNDIAGIESSHSLI